MIDIETALELVLSHSPTITRKVDVDLANTLGYTLAEDVISAIDMPPFRQSAMDGYALRMNKNGIYKVIDEVKAGDGHNPILNIGEAVRIFTGALVPDNANTVAIQEKVSVNGNEISTQESIELDKNIRRKGEQIKKDTVALQKGTSINASHIGFLASLGVTRVSVFKKPTIAIVVTGNELVPPGKTLSLGKIYESNGIMLSSVLKELGYKKTAVITVKDDFESTKATLENTIGSHDIVIVTGGVSVGDYDFVGRALVDIGVDEIFYKVKQKPGKPLFFGKRGQKAIFGLPGNPAAALSCFYIYVYPLLKKSEGALNVQLERISLPLLTDYNVKGNRAQFLKARIQGNGVEILTGQSSAMIRAFGSANALVFLPENRERVRKGQQVITILLPN